MCNLRENPNPEMEYKTHDQICGKIFLIHKNHDKKPPERPTERFQN